MFSKLEAVAFQNALDDNSETSPFVSDFSTIQSVLTSMIERAWGEEEIVLESG
eukprot:CAMPEP_0172500400 /NCGR_PEP_ID=MMETSP1066-20121228/137659_1 /TAXON_ID=671091 /ORGANISM="Coscinodiscus wailesii, Strain CCMP2513" /LENGTH=52 /DNA_ID=CAMNT_0013274603 /DNA_START=1 /DNA_END=155 /DNA_ORIENTATION=+